MLKRTIRLPERQNRTSKLCSFLSIQYIIENVKFIKRLFKGSIKTSSSNTVKSELCGLIFSIKSMIFLNWLNNLQCQLPNHIRRSLTHHLLVKSMYCQTLILWREITLVNLVGRLATPLLMRVWTYHVVLKCWSNR